MPVVPVIQVTDGSNVPENTSGNPFTPNSGGGNNAIPVLITPEVQANHIIPHGSGSSMITEPDLVVDSPLIGGTKPPKDIQQPQNADTSSGGAKPPKDVVNNIINYLPPFMGGGVGGGGGATDDSANTNVPKKPNYVLYGGILLALIIAYKVLSKNKK